MPKVMISTVAAGNAKPFVEVKDIVLIFSLAQQVVRSST